MSLTMPQEVIDIIIDNCHDDRKTLFACSLVCKSWLPSTRYHLFRSLWLSNSRSQNRVDNFIDLLKWPTSSFITENVENLDIMSQYSCFLDEDAMEVNEDDGNDSKWLLSRLAPYFDRFSSVRELHLLYMICTSSSLQPLFCFSGITKLNIHGLLFRDFTQFLEIVLLSPALDSLYIYDTMFTCRQDDLPSTRLPSKLRQLSIINCGDKQTSRILRWLADGSPPPMLEELTLQYSAQDSLHCMQKIINHSAQTLRLLDLSFDRDYLSGSPETDLSECIELQVINLKGVQKPSICHYIYDMITSIRSNKVHKIVFPMIDRYGLTDYTIPYWNTLDELFNSDVRFSNLCSVTVFDDSQWPGYAMVTKKSLPLTFAKGIIKIKETV